MSPQLTAALYGGLAGGVVGGTLGIVGIFLGLFAERYLRRRGNVRCVPNGWKLSPQVRDEYGGTGAAEASAVTSARYSFGVKFFNEKDVDTGLRDLAVEFRWRDGSRTTDRPWDSSTTRVRGGATTSERVEVLNLPSREWVSLSLHGTVGPEVAGNMQACRGVALVGHFPTGRTFRESVPTQDGEPKSWVGRLLGR